MTLQSGTSPHVSEEFKSEVELVAEAVEGSREHVLFYRRSVSKNFPNEMRDELWAILDHQQSALSQQMEEAMHLNLATKTRATGNPSPGAVDPTTNSFGITAAPLGNGAAGIVVENRTSHEDPGGVVGISQARRGSQGTHTGIRSLVLRQ